MEKEIYDKSVQTRELQLVGFGPNLSHFGLVGFLLIPPVTLLLLHIIDYFQSIPITFREEEIWFIIIPPILATIVFLIQKRRLRFRVIQTKLNHIQLKKILVQVGKELRWIVISSSKDSCVATTNPGFFSGSWGEQITILFYQDYVFINSICDPSKHPSVVSWGRNNRHEETFIERIKEEEYQSESATHASS